MRFWRSFKLWIWYWATWRPAICCTCGRIYERDAFWNPWGDYSGSKRLACSPECAEIASPGCTEGLG